MTDKKLSYMQPGDPGSESAICSNCEEPSSKSNPIVAIKRPGHDPIYSHVDCPSYRDWQTEQNELSSRNANIWAFAAVNKYADDQGGIMTTPMTTNKVPKSNPKVAPMTKVQAAPEYDDDDTGASQPPSK